MRIVYKRPYSIDLRLNTMCTVHGNFAPASVVLLPNVHLHSIGKDQVSFIEFDSTMDLLNVRKNPILHIAHLKAAKKLSLSLDQLSTTLSLN